MFLSEMKVEDHSELATGVMFVTIVAEWWQLTSLVGAPPPRKLVGREENFGWFCLPMADIG